MKKVLAFLLIAVFPTTLFANDNPKSSNGSNGAGHGNRGTGRASSSRGYRNGNSRSLGRGNPSYRPSPRSYGGGHYGGTGTYSNGGSYGRNSSRNVAGNSGRSISPEMGGSGNLGNPRIAYGRQMLPGSLRHSSPRLPSRGPQGSPSAFSPVSPRRMSSAQVRGSMSRIAASPGFSRQAYTYNATESMRGHYYWHNFNGQDFCHYCDQWGGNWYGWCVGGAFFWTQFYWGNWWWCNPAGNWCYWYDGNWWWQDPETDTVYIYENGNYVPSDNGNYPPPGSGNDASAERSDRPAENANPDYGEEAAGANSPARDYGSQGQDRPAKPDEPAVFTSPDGTVTVHLEGAGHDAFLYQMVADGNSKPVYLGSNVSNVLYSDQDGELRILLVMNDGSFEVFKGDGSPLEVKPPGSGGKTAGYES